MSSEWTVWVMWLDGSEVTESAPGEVAAFARREELEAERGTAYGAACLPPGSADLAVLFGRKLGSALAGQADKYGDSGVA